MYRRKPVKTPRPLLKAISSLKAIYWIDHQFHVQHNVSSNVDSSADETYGLSDPQWLFQLRVSQGRKKNLIGTVNDEKGNPENMLVIISMHIENLLQGFIVGADDIEFIEQKLQDYITGKGIFDPEYRIILDNGETRYIQASAIIERDSDNQPFQLFGFNFDITERKENENIIRNLNLELNQLIDQRTKELAQLKAAQQSALQNERLATIGTMAAGLAHELNNPLMGILNYIQFVKNHPSDERNEALMSKAEKELKRMGHVTKELLLFSRSSKIEIEKHRLEPIIKKNSRFTSTFIRTK